LFFFILDCYGLFLSMNVIKDAGTLSCLRCLNLTSTGMSLWPASITKST
jgi:hypothetical protein